VGNVLKLFDDSIIEVYECREDIVKEYIVKSGIDGYIAFSKNKTYIPIRNYEDGFVFINDNGDELPLPYRLLDKYFKKKTLKVEDMRKFKCVKDLYNHDKSVLYFREGCIYKEIGYNYGGIILLDETGGHHSLSDSFWHTHMVEVDDTAIDFSIK
jgi:hypothetical protein